MQYNVLHLLAPFFVNIPRSHFYIPEQPRTCGVTTKSVLTTETRRKRTLFVGIEDGVGRAEEVFQDDKHASEQLGEQKLLSGDVKNTGFFVAGINLLVVFDGSGVSGDRRRAESSQLTAQRCSHQARLDRCWNVKIFQGTFKTKAQKGAPGVMTRRVAERAAMWLANLNEFIVV